jgi:hypothetical protein
VIACSCLRALLTLSQKAGRSKANRLRATWSFRGPQWWREEGRGLYDRHGGAMALNAGLVEVYPMSLMEIGLEDALKIGLNRKPWVLCHH